MILLSDLHFGRLPLSTLNLLEAAILGDSSQIVVIAGDITEDATDSEFEQARLFVQGLIDHEVTVILTPGNHDFGGWFAEQASGAGGAFRDPYERARAQLATLMKTVYSQSAIVAHNPEQFDTITKVGDDVFVALCSEHRKCPRITKAQVTWASNVLLDMGVRMTRLSSLYPHSSHSQSLSHSTSPSPRNRSFSDFPSVKYSKMTVIEPITSDSDDCSDFSVTPSRPRRRDSMTIPASPNPSNLRLHLITHHSLWQDDGDRHSHIRRRKRLECKLLAPFSFYSVIHGHNHRFTYQNTTTPKTVKRLLRISVPTVSTKNKRWERGWAVWFPKRSEPQLVMISDDQPIPRDAAYDSEEEDFKRLLRCNSAVSPYSSSHSTPDVSEKNFGFPVRSHSSSSFFDVHNPPPLLSVDE